MAWQSSEAFNGLERDNVLSSVRIVVFWSLIPLLIPLAAIGIGMGGDRVDRFFFTSSGILPGLLLWIVPWNQMSPGFALAATLAFSTAVEMLYLALVPSARRAWFALLVVLGIIDSAALLVIYLSQASDLGIVGSMILLAVTAIGVEGGAVWVVRRLRRARDANLREE
jgi:hypothetical protein